MTLLLLRFPQKPPPLDYLPGYLPILTFCPEIWINTWYLQQNLANISLFLPLIHSIDPNFRTESFHKNFHVVKSCFCFLPGICGQIG